MNENPDNEPPKNFWQDTADCWRCLPNKAFFFALLAVWLALFQFLGNPILGYVHTPSLFSWMIGAYNSPSSDDAHGNYIPFLVIGLFWWKRRELLALPLKFWWPGLLILLAALMLHIAGFAVQQPYLSIAALFAGIYGLTGLAWGRAWLRNSLFPFFLFIFSVPLGQRGESITFPLRQLVAWLSEKTAHILGVDVIRVGTQLLDSSGSYGFDVAAPCSGMRSLIMIFLLASIISFMFLHLTRNRVFLMALVVPFAVLGNLLRLLLIIFAAEFGGQRWGDYAHENFIISLVPYIPAIIGFLLVGFWLEDRELKKSSA